MARVDLQAVLRDTVQPRPEIQHYWKWLVAGVAVVVVVAAIQFPASLLIAVAIGCVLALMIRFAYCYLKARDAAAESRVRDRRVVG